VTETGADDVIDGTGNDVTGVYDNVDNIQQQQLGRQRRRSRRDDDRLSHAAAAAGAVHQDDATHGSLKLISASTCWPISTFKTQEITDVLKHDTSVAVCLFSAAKSGANVMKITVKISRITVSVVVVATIAFCFVFLVWIASEHWGLGLR